MKANEFVKAMGINAVRQFLENDNIRTKEMHDDLKRLVESHDLVTSYNGLHGAKNTLKLLISSIEIGLYHGIDGVNAEVEIPRLKQAIADYEAIGGEHV